MLSAHDPDQWTPQSLFPPSSPLGLFSFLPPPLTLPSAESKSPDSLRKKLLSAAFLPSSGLAAFVQPGHLDRIIAR